MTQLITTTLGLVPEADVRIEMAQDDNEGANVWLMSRTLYYVGNDPQLIAALAVQTEAGQLDPPDHIRRDCWVSIKNGLQAQAEAHKGN